MALVTVKNDNEDKLKQQIDVQTYERCEYGRSFEAIAEIRINRSSICEIRTLYNNYMRLPKGFVFDDNSDNLRSNRTIDRSTNGR